MSPTTIPTHPPAAEPKRRKVQRRRAELRIAWTCENCAGLNAGARRRCWDCGTSRH